MLAGVAAVTTTAPTAAAASSQATITIGSTVGIPQLNPAVSTFSWEETLYPLLWDGLTQLNAKGDVVPDLATSWSSSPNSEQWQFTLRQGVKFSNGKPLTAADIVQDFRYYLKPSTPFQNANEIASIKSVSSSGNTITFRLSAPNALFPEAITTVKAIYLPSLSDIDHHPIGTGPFTVQSFVPNSTLTLVANRHYWGSAPKVAKLVFLTEPDPTSAFTALKAGTIQVMGAIPDSDVSEVAHSSSLKLVKPEVPGSYVSWEVDTKAPPFNNVKARQALAYAINAKAVLNEAYFGVGTVSTENDPISAKSPWYDPNLTKYTYNLAKAKQLFAQAGIKSGTTFTWWTTSAYPEWTTSGEILQASLKQIGINLKIVSNDVSTWAAKFYPAGKSYPGLIVPNFQSTPEEPAFSLNFFMPNRCECNWNSATYASVFNSAIGTRSVVARAKDWDRLQAMINEQVPTYQPIQLEVDAATSSSVSGVWEESGDQLHLEGASISS
jgi:peptide/nickel transport system substrate-binding protein